MEDLKANAEYTGYTAASNIIQWFWEVVKAFNKEDMARLLQFVTGTSKVSFMTLAFHLFIIIYVMVFQVVSVARHFTS